MFIKNYVNRRICVIKHFDLIRRDFVNLSSVLAPYSRLARLDPLAVIPKLFLNLPLLRGVGRLPVPLPVLQGSLPGGPTGSVQHCRPVLASLLVEKLLLVASLPVVAGLPVFDSIDVITILHVAATLKGRVGLLSLLQTNINIGLFFTGATPK